jgi:hypothetical protein
VTSGRLSVLRTLADKMSAIRSGKKLIDELELFFYYCLNTGKEVIENI